MIKILIRNLDDESVTKLHLSRIQPLRLLRKEWGKISKLDPDLFRLMDVRGNDIPEDGIIESILIPHCHRLKLLVERLTRFKVKILGYPQLTICIKVGLSMTTDSFKELICERLVLPQREMVLRTNSKYLVVDMALRHQVTGEDMCEIISDLSFIIHLEGINANVQEPDLFCCGSDSTWNLLDSSQPISHQRLYYEGTCLPIRQHIYETLKDVGAVYLDEFYLLLECKFTVYVTHPRKSLNRKTEPFTVTRIVWPLDKISIVVTDDENLPFVALWKDKIYPLDCTFFQANLKPNSWFIVGVILSLTIIDKQDLYHTEKVPHTTTVHELMEKLIMILQISTAFHLKLAGKCLDPDATLEECGVKDRSTIFMVSKQYNTIIVCDNIEHNIGDLPEDLNFTEFLTAVNERITLKQKFNKNVIFECECQNLLTDQSLSTQHSNECLTSSMRRYGVHRQICIRVKLDSGVTLEILKSVRSRIFEIINDIIQEEEIGLRLMDGDKVLENNKRLEEYVEPSAESLELRLTKSRRLSCVTSDATYLYLESITKMLSTSGENDKTSSTSFASDEIIDFQERSSVVFREPLECVYKKVPSWGSNRPFRRVKSWNRLSFSSKEHRPSVFKKRYSDGSATGFVELNQNEFRHATEKGDTSMIKILLRNGIDVNCTFANGETALHIASQENAIDTMRLLLSFNANVNIKKDNGSTPLFEAVCAGHNEAVKLLLEYNAAVNVEMPEGISPLIFASNMGFVEIVKMLCDHGAEIDRPMKTGATALFKAVQMNNYETARVLLLNGANLNVVLDTGTTPLMRAVNDGFLNIVRLLLEFGSKVNHSREDGTTSLHISAQINDDTMTNLLIGWGADLDKHLIGGGTPLHIAAYHNSYAAMETLISSGAKINEVWLDGVTPLHVAAILGSVRSAQLLLDRGAQPNAKMDDGTTPLFIATQENQVDLIKLLISYNADVNIARNDGTTPLIMALKFNFTEAVNALKEARASDNFACRTQ